MQEVFEKIIEKQKGIETHCLEMNDWQGQSAIVDAIEIVKQAATEYNNGWIPADNPPKNEAYILLSFENFSVPLVGRYEEDENGGAFYIGDEEKTCTEQDIIVNAWQPLPECWKGE